MFYLTFDTTNAAFDDGADGAQEVARILRETANKIEAGNYDTIVRDSNGNKIGDFAYEVEPDINAL